MSEAKLGEEFVSIMDVNYYTSNCILDIKKLLRFYYIDQYKDGETIHNNIEEYQEYYDNATKIGVQNDSILYSASKIKDDLVNEISTR